MGGGGEELGDWGDTLYPTDANTNTDDVNENILCGPGNSTVPGDLNGKEVQREGMDVYVWLGSVSPQWKLAQHCKAAALQ